MNWPGHVTLACGGYSVNIWPFPGYPGSFSTFRTLCTEIDITPRYSLKNISLISVETLLFITRKKFYSVV